MTTTLDPRPLVILGSGAQAYREYALRSAAHAAGRRLILLVRDEPTWQRSIVEDCRVADLADPAAVVAQLCHSAPAGVLTWDETVLRTAARVADALRLPHMTVRAADGCRDKLATRVALAARGVPSAQFRHVRTRPEAAQAAHSIGFPVVMKPRGLAGSVGVTLVRRPEEVSSAYAAAAGASVPGLARNDGVLVEEFLDGPEVSVDSVVRDGHVTPVLVARKDVGFPPSFEELGHVAVPWRHEPWADALCRVIVAAHRALGVTHGVTHTEVRLTTAGPYIVEVNGRLGGDLIPHVGRLATGVDLPAAAARLALGEAPDLHRRLDRCAAVRFLYPPGDVRVTGVRVSPEADGLDWLDRIAVLATPGTELLLPPRGLVPRYAAVVVTGSSEEECRDRLYQATRLVTLLYEPLG